MGLSKVYLGDVLQLEDQRNADEDFGADAVRGISVEKIFIKTKANLKGVSLSSYKVVQPGFFVYVSDTSRRGGKICTAFNDSKDPLLVSSISTVFSIAKKRILLDRYLYMFFNRPEFDRYARFNSWGSARETFSWEDLCDTEINLPPIEVQRKYVAIYEAMLANQRTYESELDNLKLTCDVLIEKLMRETPHQAIGQFIEQVDVRNDGSYSKSDVRGLSVSKQLIETKANLDGVNLTSYKTIQQNCLAYLVDTSRRGDKISVAINESPCTFITSSVNTVFKVRDGVKGTLLPGYLMLFFNRPEFDRYARFNSWGSARETFDWDEMCHVHIPIPSIDVQQYAVALYRTWRTRQRINEQLKEHLKEICPILVKGSIEEARE